MDETNQPTTIDPTLFEDEASHLNRWDFTQEQSDRLDCLLLGVRVVLVGNLCKDMELLEDVPNYIIQYADKFRAYIKEGTIPALEQQDEPST